MLSVTAMLTALTQLDTTTALAELDMREMVSHVQVDNIVLEKFIHSGMNATVITEVCVLCVCVCVCILIFSTHM